MTHRLHVDIIGKGNPLILLHGWGWNSRIWESLVPQLAEKFQLFCIDLPGFGKNHLISTSYNIIDLADLLLAVTPVKSAWLGWSLGGMIAWHIALNHPERVTRLITVASSPKFIGTENWPGVPLPTLEKFSRLLQENYQKTLREFLELQLRGASKSNELFAQLQPHIIHAPHALPALTEGLNLLKNLDLRSNLDQQQCKSLHLFGSHDTLVPVSIAEKIKILSPQTHCVVVKKSGHMPFLSQQEIFIEVIEKFLAT